uniref:Uncharacterized protein n=1 Tax=Cyprinodon variegatus TaxID=28743 RepID=A0A3Q2C975_CYPVA
MEKQIIPSLRKEAIISITSKDNREKLECSNYHPIRALIINYSLPILTVRHDGGGGVMIWCCFDASIDRTMNSDSPKSIRKLSSQNQNRHFECVILIFHQTLF